MCDACMTAGQNPYFVNGDHYEVTKVRLYGIYYMRAAVIELCYVHDIELFQKGTYRFLMAYPELVGRLNRERRHFTDLEAA